MPHDLDRPGRARELLFEQNRIRFYIDPSFPAFVKSEIRAAVGLAIEILSLERLESHPLYDCALSHVTEPVHSDWLLYQLGLWHDLLYGSPNGYPIQAALRGRVDGFFMVGIVQLWDENEVAGKAYVGHFYNGPSIIAVNRQWVNGELTFSYPTLSQIAGVVVHEMLHTFGLEHPNGEPGSYIGEYGWCFARKFGELTDEYKLFSL